MELEKVEKSDPCVTLIRLKYRYLTKVSRFKGEKTHIFQLSIIQFVGIEDRVNASVNST